MEIKTKLLYKYHFNSLTFFQAGNRCCTPLFQEMLIFIKRKNTLKQFNANTFNQNCKQHSFMSEVILL